jgi:NADPH2 dehydrogenase
MAQPFQLTRIPTLKSVDAFRRHVRSLALDLRCDDRLQTGDASPLTRPVQGVSFQGKTIGNRWAVHPMEGWDATPGGDPSPEVVRRWQRFGLSGAKLIYGGEAMAVCPEGRANPNQLIIEKGRETGLASLIQSLKEVHLEHNETTDDLVIGFQLTHSGRFCRPSRQAGWQSRVAYRHPILDKKFNVDSDDQILSDEEVRVLIQKYIQAAQVAHEAGADFVDIKHCHGYLLHEFLGAHTRPGDFGGSFENRTRILREIVDGIRTSGNPIDIGVRISAFDFVPFCPDPGRATAGKLGPGIPESYQHCLPYHYGFAVNPDDPVGYHLDETFQWIDLCASLGIKILNVSAGSPYYNPHIQRPAAYPPSDGYQPAHDPLIDVERQIQVVRQLKAKTPGNMVVVGSAYSYLQEYLPHVAQHNVREGWTDMVGLGRVILSYPDMLSDATTKGVILPKMICRTFSDCTTAPRNGLISGCFPLDPHYKEMPQYKQLKEIKKSIGT